MAAAVLVVLAIAIGAFAFLHARELASRPTAGHSPSTTASSPSSSSSGSSNRPAVIAGPAATVRAYYTAINNKNYGRAWNLGARNLGQSYQSFVSGYSSTERDTATILSVTGNVVTAHLRAVQTDGTVKTFQGTYTVEDGVITKFHVVQLG